MMASRHLVRVRREIPWAPLVLVTSNGTSQHLAAVGAVAGELGARAITTRLDAEWPELLHRLFDCEALGEHFARWVSIQRPDISRVMMKRMEALVLAGLAGEHVHDVAAAFDITPRDLEHTFRRAQLARPSTYVQFGRLIPRLSLLCREPGTRLIDAADASQYSRRARLHPRADRRSRHSRRRSKRPRRLRMGRTPVAASRVAPRSRVAVSEVTLRIRVTAVQDGRLFFCIDALWIRRELHGNFQLHSGT